MTPKEITLQLDLLKEKAKNYSFISRSYKIDEIRSDVKTINDKINDFNREVDNILIDGIISNFNIDNWFEGFKDKTEFTEPNPRLVYEEKQREIERQRKLDEEKKQRELKELYERQKEEKIQTFRKFLVVGNNDFDMIKDFLNKGINIEEDISDIDLNWLLKHGRDLKYIELLINAGLNITEKDRQELARLKKEEESRDRQKKEEIEKLKKIEAENEAKEAEERTKRLQIKYRIDEFRKICLDKKSEDLVELQKLLGEGLDINCINDFDALTKNAFWNKSLNFIKIIVDSGLHITERTIRELFETHKYRHNKSDLFDILISAKNIDPVALTKVNDAIASQKKTKLEQLRLQKQKEQSNRIKEFKDMCQFSFSADINKLKKLIEVGLNINEIEDFDCLESCISWGSPNLPFIQLLVDSGILVKNKHIEYCYTNKLYAIISILEKAKNIENSAVKNIFKRKKNAMIGSISLTCIFIFSLFLPEILNRKMDSFYFILVGAITILSLIMAINFIVDFRKKSKINDINHILENQSLHPKQTGYEIPNIQGITGSVKEFNHKEIRSEKMILWIAFTLISISIIVLIYIFFEEIMGFFKILLILLLLPFLLPIILKKR